MSRRKQPSCPDCGQPWDPTPDPQQVAVWKAVVELDDAIRDVVSHPRWGSWGEMLLSLEALGRLYEYLWDRFLEAAEREGWL